MRDFVDFLRAPDFVRDPSVDGIYYDLDAITHRVDEACTLRDAFRYRQTSRLTIDHLQDICIGIGFTSSMAGYMRQGEPWRYAGARPGSNEARSMTFKMDRLRFAIIEKLPSISSLNTAHVSDETRQAFALMALSLNAIADHETLNMMIRMAGLWPETQDPQGDAQLECEEAFADDRPAQPNRAADAPGEHHAQKCGLKKTSPFPLAQ